jgi:hypothetical protein
VDRGVSNDGNRAWCTGLPLARVCEVVSASNGIERLVLARRGGWRPARMALACLDRHRTTATDAEPTAIFGVLRAESVPNLTRWSGARLACDVGVREQLSRMEEELDGAGSSEKT